MIYLNQSLGNGAMKYFAYDDKMFTPCLHHIVQDANCLGVARLAGYKLYFHKRTSQDYSGKCNLVRVNDPAVGVYGVVYQIDTRDKYLLDKIESLGYGTQEIALKVEMLAEDGQKTAPCYAFTYIAHKDNVFEDLVPFRWYRDLVVVGAREHHLPLDYIHHLEQIAAMQDPNVARETKQKRFLESHISSTF